MANSVTTSDSHTPTVLVVDDVLSQRILLAETMAQAGLEVHEATNGVDAVRMFGEIRPDLVLMDIKMPKMDGIEACARMREIESLKDIPIVLITGLEDHQSIQRAFEVDATDFITKPVNWPILGLRVRYLLKASRAFRDLRESERQLSQAQRIAVLGNWEWDIASDSLRGSSQTFDILGLESDRLEHANENLIELIHPDDRDKFSGLIDRAVRDHETFGTDLRLLLADQSELTVQLEGEIIFDADDKPLKLQGTVQDISKRKRAEERIFNLAYFDPLTGLPNRTHFKRHAQDALAQASRLGHKVALMFLDLDGFKRVNDTLGHDRGDELLKTISLNLARGLRASDSIAKITATDDTGTTLSRLGGDEFTILLGELDDSRQAAAVAQRVIDHLGHPVWLRDNEIRITGSVGIAVFPDDGDDVDTLLKHADIAMYQAKAAGKNGYQFYAAQMNSHTTERLELESKLRRAIDNDELELHFQPQVVATSGEIVGMEALVRWNSPEQGLIGPNVFIPIAEESGLIVPLGDWVLQAACREAAKWPQAHGRELRISVNISSLQFRQRDFADTVVSALDVSGLDPRMLELEMTEGSIMQQVDSTIDDLRRLKELGLALSIDDFGTGYSSLSYLKRFPLDTLKIDRSFVKDIASDASDAAIIRATIALAHSLELTTVAEGVEDDAQLEYLRDLGCDLIQGYYFSRPLPAAELGTIIAAGCLPLQPTKARAEPRRRVGL